MTISKQHEAVNQDIGDKNKHDQDGSDVINLKDEIFEIGQRCSKLPTLDERTPSQIIRNGYNRQILKSVSIKLRTWNNYS